MTCAFSDLFLTETTQGDLLFIMYQKILNPTLIRRKYFFKRSTCLVLQCLISLSDTKIKNCVINIRNQFHLQFLKIH